MSNGSVFSPLLGKHSNTIIPQNTSNVLQSKELVLPTKNMNQITSCERQRVWVC